MGNGLTKKERISLKHDIDRLFTEGEWGFVHPFRYVSLRREADPNDAPVSILVSVPKRNHKRAVRRNLLKRRTKEAYRLSKGLLSPVGHHVDIALIYTSKEAEQYSVIKNAVEKILAKIGESM